MLDLVLGVALLAAGYGFRGLIGRELKKIVPEVTAEFQKVVADAKVELAKVIAAAKV